jgi:hypothetical protein
MMYFDHYTLDAICEAMGLEAFVPSALPSAPVPTLRVLLMPSFDPEGCITVQPDKIHVVFLTRQLWLEQKPCRIPELSASRSINRPEFDALVDVFRQAHREHLQKPDEDCLDGMLINAIFLDGNQRTEFRSNPHSNAQVAFTHALIKLARSSTWSFRLRKLLKRCREYLP